MRRSLVMLATSVVVAAVWSGSGGARSHACTPGMSTVGGQPVRTFCGSARATIVFSNGKRLSFSGGTCGIESNMYAVNVGAITLGRPPKAKYFGLASTGLRDGTYRNQTVGWQMPGSGGALANATVTLRNKLRSGSFSGRVIGATTTAKGTFSC